MTIKAEAIIRGAKKLKEALEKAALEQVQCLNDAYRIEGFRLKTLLQRDIIDGVVGGDRFRPLSIIARRWGYKARKNNPIHRIHHGVRYHIPNTTIPILQVGFVGPVSSTEYQSMVASGHQFWSGRTKSFKYRGISRGQWTSKSWRYLADIHQSGFTRDISDQQRMALRHRGYELLAKEAMREVRSAMKGKTLKKRNPVHRVFFLKESTTHFRTPGRPIIAPFWAQQRTRTISRIAAHYDKKLRGEFINL